MIDIIRHMNPELAHALAQIPSLVLSEETLPVLRAEVAQMQESYKAALPDVPDVVTENRTVSTVEGNPDVSIRMYHPAGTSAILPALLWIHGGGYVMGSVGEDVMVKQMVREVGLVAVSVEYRLAPETPFPGPLEDCYAALKWLHERANELKVDASRLAIGGVSAGGGLAAGLGLLARDRAQVPLCFQMLLYPMLDDRNTLSAEEVGSDAPIWTRHNNAFSWRAYLGRDVGGEDPCPYSVPARAENLHDLPPTYISTADLDVLLDEDIEYARRLLRAGVPTELHVYPGAYHGFDFIVPEAEISRRATADRIAALRQALHGQEVAAAPSTTD